MGGDGWKDKGLKIADKINWRKAERVREGEPSKLTGEYIRSNSLSSMYKMLVRSLLFACFFSAAGAMPLPLPDADCLFFGGDCSSIILIRSLSAFCSHKRMT